LPESDLRPPLDKFPITPYNMDTFKAYITRFIKYRVSRTLRGVFDIMQLIPYPVTNYYPPPPIYSAVLSFSLQTYTTYRAVSCGLVPEFWDRLKRQNYA
jgi:hypothetical protein